TKRRALALARALQDRVARPVTVHWSGCPAGCGNHGAADVGLVGKKVRLGTEVVEAVDVYIAGSSGPNATPAVRLLGDVPCDALEPILEALLRYGNFEELRTRLRAGPSSFSASREADLEKPVVPLAQPPDSGARVVRVNGQEVAVFRCEGAVYAVQNACPHAGAPLARGVVDGTHIICPEHGYRFCLRTGRCETDPSLHLRTYPIQEGQDGIIVVAGEGA
ncbi:MAG: Rieske 2Fe-2S domain-containing protein, partial [Armatimonadota bacterium]|nr:Rieske 2Fe-2S domain-containing protein [Armatimonadota bacterium]